MASIYVEAKIHGAMDDLWEKTQNPHLHERWDARFTSITYLPRTGVSEPQRFGYSTQLGFGLSVEGEGETVAERDDEEGRRTSSLRFWSKDGKSLIREGAGYWQYIPTKDGIRFLTSYDYQTRFGWLGRVVDRFVFRPLMGWATAWSFDRLRLWIEKGIDPAVSMQRSVIHALTRFVVALVWIYQGLMPKLIARHADEFAIMADAGVSDSVVPTLVTVVGLGEILFGVMVLLLFRQRWPLWSTVILMVCVTVGVAIHSPQYLMAAFNPFSLNILLATVALIGAWMCQDLPTARRCLRKKPEVN